MAKAKEFRDKSEQELHALLDELNQEIFNLRNQNSIQRKLEKPHLLKTKKRDRAKALTILKEKAGASKKIKSA
jgi:large subunit ribosomal protein L29